MNSGFISIANGTYKDWKLGRFVTGGHTIVMVERGRIVLDNVNLVWMYLR